MPGPKTAIITGAAGGIGSGLVEGFLHEGYRVVATSLHATQSLTTSPTLVLIDGDIGTQEIAAKVAGAAIQHFGSINVLANTAGIYRKNPFTDYTPDDINALISTNLLGFLYITQLAVKQMLKQQAGSVVTITAGLADHPVEVGEREVPLDVVLVLGLQYLRHARGVPCPRRPTGRSSAFGGRVHDPARMKR